MNINDYPELKEALALAINVHHDRLEHFNMCSLDVFKRTELIDAYIKDACQGELEAVLLDADIHAELGQAIKSHGSIDISNVTVDSSFRARINEIAQSMGPYLRELERVSNTQDRINE
jgi:hypothetical protein